MSPAQVPVVDPTGLCPVHYLYIRIDPADVLRGFAVSRFINIALLLSRRFWVSRHPRVPKAQKGADILSFLPPLVGVRQFHPLRFSRRLGHARESRRVWRFLPSQSPHSRGRSRMRLEPTDYHELGAHDAGGTPQRWTKLAAAFLMIGALAVLALFRLPSAGISAAVSLGPQWYDGIDTIKVFSPGDDVQRFASELHNRITGCDQIGEFSTVRQAMLLRSGSYMDSIAIGYYVP